MLFQASGRAPLSVSLQSESCLALRQLALALGAVVGHTDSLMVPELRPQLLPDSLLLGALRNGEAGLNVHSRQGWVQATSTLAL